MTREQQAKWPTGRALGVASDEPDCLRPHEMVALLLELMEDPHCAADAAIVFAKLARSAVPEDAQAWSRLETLVEHTDPWVHHELRRALARME